MGVVTGTSRVRDRAPWGASANGAPVRGAPSSWTGRGVRVPKVQPFSSAIMSDTSFADLASAA